MSEFRDHGYGLSQLTHQLRAQVPELIRSAPQLIQGLLSEDRLGLQPRLAAQLRMARLFGCPVCLGLFPRLAQRAGLDAPSVDAALEGHSDALEPLTGGAVAWVGAVVEADGEKPEMVPAQAMQLSSSQRAHLLYLTRLELVVHAAGLMFLPHRLIERAMGR